MNQSVLNNSIVNNLTLKEEYICLNSTDFTPLDTSKPTTLEVSSWVDLNLTDDQKNNGTILGYFDENLKFKIQSDILLNGQNTGSTVSDAEIISFIINGTELVVTPIPIKSAGVRIYNGGLRTLVEAYFTDNSINAIIDDGALGEYNDILIYNIIGNDLTVSYTSRLTISGVISENTTNGSSLIEYLPINYSCDDPEFVFVLNSTGEITSLKKYEVPWYIENTTEDARGNKQADIYRLGKVGINNNDPSAPLHIGSQSAKIYQPEFSDAAIYIANNGAKIYFGDNRNEPSVKVHNLSFGEYNGDSDAFAYHAKNGHRFYTRAGAYDDNLNEPIFFIRSQLDSNSYNGKIGLNTAAPRVVADFGKRTMVSGTVANTDGMILPGGTTAERPVAPIAGTIRFNEETSKFEGYDGTSWVNLH